MESGYVRRFAEPDYWISEGKRIKEKSSFKKKKVAEYIGYKEKKKTRKRLIKLAKISIWKYCFIFGTYIQLRFI